MEQEHFEWQLVKFPNGSNPYVCKTSEEFMWMALKYSMNKVAENVWLVEQTYTAYLYLDGNREEPEDLRVFFDKQKALDFAYTEGWDDVIDDVTGEVLWDKYTLFMHE